jgi:hypothetical protein
MFRPSFQALFRLHLYDVQPSLSSWGLKSVRELLLPGRIRGLRCGTSQNAFLPRPRFLERRMERVDHFSLSNEFRIGFLASFLGFR